MRSLAISKQEVEEKIKQANDAYVKAVLDIAEEYHRKVVVHYCKKRKWKFVAGMGIFILGPYSSTGPYDYSPKDIPSPNALVLREILEVLNMGIETPTSSFGSLMPDFNPGVKKDANL